MSSHHSHLYHYTSIETLALILDSKNIRFTRLDLVNDPEEGESRDLPGIGMQVFISCWTFSSRECIPQWKLYTPDMRGCRIRLPAGPFDGHFEMGEDGIACTTLREPIEYEHMGSDFPFSVARILGPSKIHYTRNAQRLKPSLVKENDEGKEYDARSVGLAKRSYWEFENESRYLIHLEPKRRSPNFVGVIQPNETPEAKADREFHQDFPFSELFTVMAPRNRWLDVPIRDEALEDLEIMLGPKAGRAETLIVEALSEHFAPTATIRPSAIRIRDTPPTTAETTTVP